MKCMYKLLLLYLCFVYQEAQAQFASTNEDLSFLDYEVENSEEAEKDWPECDVPLKLAYEELDKSILIKWDQDEHVSGKYEVNLLSSDDKKSISTKTIHENSFEIKNSLLSKEGNIVRVRRICQTPNGTELISKWKEISVGLILDSQCTALNLESAIDGPYYFRYGTCLHLYTGIEDCENLEGLNMNLVVNYSDGTTNNQNRTFQGNYNAFDIENDLGVTSVVIGYLNIDGTSIYLEAAQINADNFENLPGAPQVTINGCISNSDSFGFNDACELGFDLVGVYSNGTTTFSQTYWTQSEIENICNEAGVSSIKIFVEGDYLNDGQESIFYEAGGNVLDWNLEIENTAEDTEFDISFILELASGEHYICQTIYGLSAVTSEDYCRLFSILNMEYQNDFLSLSFPSNENGDALTTALQSLGYSLEFGSYLFSGIEELELSIVYQNANGEQKNTNQFGSQEYALIQDWITSFSLSNPSSGDFILLINGYDVDGNPIACVQNLDIDITVPDPPLPPLLNCNEDFEIIPISDFTSVTIDDFPVPVIINNFPMVLIDGERGNDGLYSGSGIFPIPIGGKQVEIEYNGLSMNSSFQVLSGNVSVVEGPGMSNFPNLNIPAITSADIICKPPPPPPGYDGEGINNVNGLDGYGFNPETGIHSITMTEYDPKGFDINGNHEETGLPYNDDGCTRDGVHHETGAPCGDQVVDPTLVINFLGGLSPDLLEKTKIAISNMIAELNISQKVSDCNSKRNLLELNNIAGEYTLGNTSNPFPLSEEGMSQKFVQEPVALSFQGVQREPSTEAFESDHIDLFECDKELLILRDKEYIFNQVLQIPVIDELVRDLELWLKEVSPEEFALISEDADKFEIWFDNNISEYIDANYEFPEMSFTAPRKYIQDLLEGGYSDYNSLASLEDNFLSLNEDEREMMQFEYEQGLRFVNGVPRAIVTEALMKERSKLSHLLDGNQYQQLPIEITKETDNYTYSIYIYRINITTTSATLNAELVITDPETQQKLAFHAEDIPFLPNGFDGDVKLSLVNEVDIPVTNSAKIKLHGNEENYVIWDCNGFKQIRIAGTVEFCTEYVIKLDDNYNPLPLQPYELDVDVTMDDWMEFKVGLSLAPFSIKGMEKYKWIPGEIILDMSSLESHQASVPSAYDSDYVSGSTFLPSWKGVYMSSLKVIFPEDYKNGNDPYEVTVSNLIIDGTGASGRIKVDNGENVLEFGEGNASGWQFSISSLHLDIAQNRIYGGGFGGDIGVPVLKEPMEYDATVSAGGDFMFEVDISNTNRMDMFFGSVDLGKMSHIKAGYLNDSLLLIANLSGKITIDAGIEELKGIGLPTIEFQNFRVSNKDPYFDSGHWGLGLNNDPSNDSSSDEDKQGSFDLFGVTIDSIKVWKPEAGPTDEIYLGIGISMDIIEDALTAGGAVDIIGKLNQDSNSIFQKWQYHGFKVRRFWAEGTIKETLYLAGGVEFYEPGSHDTNGVDYGKGFRGLLDVQLTSLGSSTVGAKAVGMFGNVDEKKYFFIDILVNPGVTVAVGPIELTGFGGGLSNSMSVNYDVVPAAGFEVPDISTIFTSPLGTTMTGFVYQPDFNAGPAFKILTTYQTLKTKDLLNGTGEIVFKCRPDWSFEEIEFRATAKMLVPIEDSDFLTSVSNMVDDLPDFLDTEGVPPGDVEAVPAPPGEAAIHGFLHTHVNFRDFEMYGALAIYLDAGVIKGAGKDNALVMAEVKFKSAEDWYVYVGTPEFPAGIKLDIPAIKLGATAYFDMGTKIPVFPGLPENLKELDNRIVINESLRSSGQGLIFGAAIDFEANVNFYVVGGEMKAGAGFDLMFRNFGDVKCGGEQIGVNGWYAMGQLWAYVTGEVKFLGQNVFEAGVAAVLQASAPNPTWVSGTIDIHVKYLGSIRGNVELGEQCVLEFEEPLDAIGLEFVSSLNPTEDMEGVNVDALGEAIFLTSLKDEFDITVNGETKKYKIEIDVDNSGFFHNGFELKSLKTVSNEITNMRFEPIEMLPGESEVELRVKLDFYESSTGSDYVYLASQERIDTFTTGQRLTNIPGTNILTSYPKSGMSNMYIHESNQAIGYMKLKTGQADLFVDTGLPVYAHITNGAGATMQTLVKYSIVDQEITYPLPTDFLEKEQFYRVQLLQSEEGIPTSKPGDETLTSDLPEPIYEMYFRTSAYDTFAEKVQANHELLLGAYGNASKTNLEGAVAFMYKLMIDEPFDHSELRNNIDFIPSNVFGAAGLFDISTPVVSHLGVDPLSNISVPSQSYCEVIFPNQTGDSDIYSNEQVNVENANSLTGIEDVINEDDIDSEEEVNMDYRVTKENFQNKSFNYKSNFVMAYSVFREKCRRDILYDDFTAINDAYIANGEGDPENGIKEWSLGDLQYLLGDILGLYFHQFDWEYSFPDQYELSLHYNIPGGLSNLEQEGIKNLNVPSYFSDNIFGLLSDMQE